MDKYVSMFLQKFAVIIKDVFIFICLFPTLIIHIIIFVNAKAGATTPVEVRSKSLKLTFLSSLEGSLF